MHTIRTALYWFLAAVAVVSLLVLAVSLGVLWWFRDTPTFWPLPVFTAAWVSFTIFWVAAVPVALFAPARKRGLFY